MRTSGTLWVLFFIGIISLVAAANVKRQRCRANEFMCDNGERCIHQFDKCDGVKNCPDGSDESLANCQSFGLTCGETQPNAFKCAYGACIDGFKACDGKAFDCADNSDEEHCHKPIDMPQTTARCQSTEFNCKSGECVSLNDVCDGTPNCQDKSDETIAQCALMSCPPFSFQCAYGACIDGDKGCDGTIHCADGSDEASDLCNKQVDTPNDPTINKAGDANSTAESCPFPSHPYTVYTRACKGASCHAVEPGTPVKRSNTVLVSCQPGYALPKKFEKKAYMVCLAPPIFHLTITCEKMCHPLVSKYHDLECKYDRKDVPCDRPMHPGTIVHLGCKEFFKPKSDFRAVTQTQCLTDGTWVDELYTCIPDKGDEAEKTTTAPLGTRVGATFRLTHRTMVCLALFDAGLLPRITVQTTPRTYYLVVVRPDRLTITPLRRVKRDAFIVQYRHTVEELNTFVRYSSHVDSDDDQPRTIRSVLAELQSFFPKGQKESISEYYDDLAEAMERRHLQRGLATCNLINDTTLLYIIDVLDRKLKQERIDY